jgi:WD repeat-containing protein 89
MEKEFEIAAKIDKSNGNEDYPQEIIVNPQDSAKFAVGLSSGSIHLMDLNTLYKPLVINNDQVLNRILYDPVDPNLLWFGTRKSLNCVDLRLQTKVLEIPKIKNEFLSFDISQSRLASIGTELFQDSPLLFYDLRNSSQPIGKFDVHSDDITQVKFNPADSNLMMTGSTDGLFCLYNLGNGLDEDEALYQCIKGNVYV